MPCEKCENGKYKWGKTGSCKYDTKADCESDNKDYYEDMKETKIVELIIQDDNQELAIDAISLVTSPAIEQDFVFFGKEKNNLTFAKIDEEKRMLISPALIPGKTIFRHDPQTSSDYFVFFSKATVRKASELYLKHNNHHKATYQHQDRISGILTVESWIIEDSKLDKSTLYGFSLPVGTWMVKLKISNDEIWSKIKDGELKGLSIEGYFTNKFEQMNKTKEPTTAEILSAFNELVKEGKVKKMSLEKRLTLAKRFDLASIKDVDKLMKSMSQKASIVESIFNELDGELLDRRVLREDAEEQLQNANDYKQTIEGSKEEVELAKSRLDKAKDELKDSQDGFKEENDLYKKLVEKAKKQDKLVTARQKQYVSESKEVGKQVSQLKKAYADLQKAAKTLGIDKVPVDMYEEYLKDGEEWGTGKLPS